MDERKGNTKEDALNPVTPDGKGGGRETESKADDPNCLKPVRPYLVLRSMHTCSALDLTGKFPARVFVRDVAGGIYSIITVDKFASARAADASPMLDAIRQYGEPRRDLAYAEFIQGFEFLFAAARRANKDENEPTYSLNADATDGGKHSVTPMLELCFVTTIPNKSLENKKSMLEVVAKVSRFQVADPYTTMY